MTPGDWINLASLIGGVVAFLVGAAGVVYRIGRIEAAVASRLGVIDEKVQQILDGKAAPCALHAAQLELHARQIDALFRRVNSEPMHHGDGMRPATEGGA